MSLIEKKIWFSVFFLWVFGILMGLLFAHHKKFGGFRKWKLDVCLKF